MSARRPNNAPRRTVKSVSNNRPASKQVVRQMIKSIVSSKTSKKYYGISGIGTVDSGGLVFPIFRPTIGDGDSSRDGDEVFYGPQAEFHYVFGAADATNVMRIVIFKWNDLSVPQPSDVIQSSYLGGTTAPLAPINFDNRDRMKIYHNRMVSMTLGTSTQLHSRDVFYSPTGKPQWINQSATDGSGQIYVLIISDSSAGSHPAYEFGSLIQFTDS